MECITYWQAWVRSKIHACVRTEKGAALVEYALLLALIAVVCIVAITTLGSSSKNKFQSVATQISRAGS